VTSKAVLERWLLFLQSMRSVRTVAGVRLLCQMAAPERS
jgi:hypothetical protein